MYVYICACMYWHFFITFFLKPPGILSHGTILLAAVVAAAAPHPPAPAHLPHPAAAVAAAPQAPLRHGIFI
jgi:hypothetical protein